MKSNFWLWVSIFCFGLAALLSVREDWATEEAHDLCEQRCHPAAGGLLDGECTCAGAGGWWQVQP